MSQTMDPAIMGGACALVHKRWGMCWGEQLDVELIFASRGWRRVVTDRGKTLYVEPGHVPNHSVLKELGLDRPQLGWVYRALDPRYPNRLSEVVAYEVHAGEPMVRMETFWRDGEAFSRMSRVKERNLVPRAQGWELVAFTRDDLTEGHLIGS